MEIRELSTDFSHPGVVHIGTAFDKGYLRQFAAFAASVMENHERGQVFFHLIIDGVQQDFIEEIKQWIASFNNCVSVYEIDETKVDSFALTGDWSRAVFYRLFLPDLLPGFVNRLVYLDCDTIVLKSLSSLNGQDLECLPVGAVWDNYVRTQPLIGILEEGKYFNSGFMLIDVAKWHHLEISSKAIQFLSVYPERIRFVDQCALNAVLIENWFRLPESCNLLFSFVPDPITKREMKKLISETHVVHFTLDRPWKMPCKNRLRFLYFRYLKRSPFGYLNAIDDFSVSYLSKWLRIRLVECYHDSDTLQTIWRGLKKLTT